MHELSIAMSLIETATEEARRRQVGPIKAIHVTVGPLSGVVKDCLAAAFELARDGTVMPDAQLVITDAPVVVFCPSCHMERAVASIQRIRCGVCGTPTPDVRRGRELEITALEVSS